MNQSQIQSLIQCMKLHPLTQQQYITEHSKSSSQQHILPNIDQPSSKNHHQLIQSPPKIYNYYQQQLQTPNTFQISTQAFKSQLMVVAKSIKTNVKQIKTKPKTIHQLILLSSHVPKFNNEVKSPGIFSTIQDGTYKYYLGPGNNSELVRKILSIRENWRETSEGNSMLVNFKWQQSERGYKYKMLTVNPNYKQLVNHYEHHCELSNKQYLIKNLTQYCEAQKMNVFDLTPPTFVLDFVDDFCDVNLTNFFKFYEQHMPIKIKRGYQDFNKLTMEIKRKLRGFVPSSVPQDKKNVSYTKLKMSSTLLEGPESNYLWLLKPTFLNRGRGIHIFSNLETFSKLVNEYQEGFVEKQLKKEDEEDNSPKQENVKQQQNQLNIIKQYAFIVQKYIERPYLINQRKFDIRVWVLLTHQLDVYVFKEGYIRTSSEAFKVGDIDNVFVHLTNNAIQKFSENYGQFENGNQLSWGYFEKLVQQNDIQFDFRNKIYSQIKELVLISMNSVKKQINFEESKYCMEIFGYDFIIDEEMKTYIIEVNTNPCIEESSELLKSLIPRMLGITKIEVDDAFKLTLDRLFPSRNKQNIEFKVEGYDNENMWEQICSLQKIKQGGPKHIHSSVVRKK